MSNVQESREKFVSMLDAKISGSAGDIFDEGLTMAEAGASKDEIKAFLSARVQSGGEVSVLGDAGSCASDCRGQCADYPDGAPWYACYAGCFAGCMSA